jgi:hypothetical protein
MFPLAMSIFSSAVAPRLKNWKTAKLITGCHDLVSEKLVTVTPMLAAIRDTGETSAAMMWETYEAATAPILKTLPTVIRNEDTLIKELP